MKRSSQARDETEKMIELFANSVNSRFEWEASSDGMHKKFHTFQARVWRQDRFGHVHARPHARPRRGVGVCV